ncbi:MAG: hypothetical protein ABJC19_11380 [Gemmatimonadota bacterium]
MMRSLLLLPLLIAPLAGQVVLTTATGVTRIEGGLSSRDAAAVEGRVRLGTGLLRLDAAAATIAHDGIGHATMAHGDLSAGVERGEWSGRIGPVLRAGGGLGDRSSIMYGGGGELRRRFGPGSLALRLERGIAQVAKQHSNWSRESISGSFAVGSVDFGFAWQRATIRDSMLRDNVFFGVRDPSADSLLNRRVRSLQDFSLSAAWGIRDFAFSVEAGRRAGDAVASQFWWRGGASLEVAPLIALVANVSRTPPDLMLGLRGGRSTMIGLRLNLAGGRSVGHRSRGAMLVESRREDGGWVRLILVLDARERAELVGDATGWRPVALTQRSDGRWEAVLQAAPGLSRFNVALDGGPWTTPRGLPGLADEFGGVAFLVEL